MADPSLARALTCLGAVLLATAPVARAESWSADAASSRIVVNVLKQGLFSGFAHDHRFEVTDWSATVEIPARDPASVAVQVVAAADSLRDRQKSLSGKDLEKVNAQAAGPEVLDAQRHPRVEFRSERFEVAPGTTPEHVRGTLHGTLTLRGRSAPLELAVDATKEGAGWRVRGDGRVKQSAFGIKPFSGFGGTVGVKDELRIDFLLTLRRAG